MSQEEIFEMNQLEVEGMFYGYCSLSDEAVRRYQELHDRFMEEGED